MRVTLFINFIFQEFGNNLVGKQFLTLQCQTIVMLNGLQVISITLKEFLKFLKQSRRHFLIKLTNGKSTKLTHISSRLTSVTADNYRNKIDCLNLQLTTERQSKMVKEFHFAISLPIDYRFILGFVIKLSFSPRNSMPRYWFQIFIPIHFYLLNLISGHYICSQIESKSIGLHKILSLIDRENPLDPYNLCVHYQNCNFDNISPNYSNWGGQNNKENIGIS